MAGGGSERGCRQAQRRRASRSRTSALSCDPKAVSNRDDTTLGSHKARLSILTAGRSLHPLITRAVKGTLFVLRHFWQVMTTRALGGWHRGRKGGSCDFSPVKPMVKGMGGAQNLRWLACPSIPSSKETIRAFASRAASCVLDFFLSTRGCCC